MCTSMLDSAPNTVQLHVGLQIILDDPIHGQSIARGDSTPNPSPFLQSDQITVKILYLVCTIFEELLIFSILGT